MVTRAVDRPRDRGDDSPYLYGGLDEKREAVRGWSAVRHQNWGPDWELGAETKTGQSEWLLQLTVLILF